MTVSCDTTLSGVSEPNAIDPALRIDELSDAKDHSINTWVSFESVFDTQYVLAIILAWAKALDTVKIGKLNYYPSDIDWAEFGRVVENICREMGVDSYIKDSLREDMNKK